ncbi:hypothetical protein KC332_g63 [Hortaea werneckii]|nr:hypothetical protein KC332_g63 [Hortaea werneckii]
MYLSTSILPRPSVYGTKRYGNAPLKCAFNRTRKMSRWSAMIAKDDAWNHPWKGVDLIAEQERHRRVADDQEFTVLSDTATALVEERLPSGPL